MSGDIAVGLRGRKTGSVGELGRADPRAADSGRKLERLATNGSTKIITIAQTITVAIAIDACSLRVPTAPAIAIAAETPQTAPPTPSVAANRCSRPSLRATT